MPSTIRNILNTRLKNLETTIFVALEVEVIVKHIYIYIYVLQLKNTKIMASCFFIHMNVEEFKPKMH
jgi:hypothetical protein